MADVVYFDSGTVLPFCPSTVNGIYISGSGCCSDFYTAFVGGNQTYNLTYTLPTASGSSGQVLTNDGNGNLSWTTVSGGGGGTGTLTGTGTTNYLSKWSSSSGLTNSIVLETGSTIDISGALRVTASSGTATAVMGRDANGYVSNLSLGNGLSISGGTLSFTGSTGVSGNFVPYLGATGNTDLGGYGIAGSYFQLSTSTGGTLVPGMFSWNGTDGTADLMLKGGTVTLPIGETQLARVINETGANLLKSQYNIVRVNGSTGTRLKVALALASGDATSAETLGIVAENITLNQEGFVITSGIIRGINTTGSLQGETWLDGDMLFLSPFVAGALTNIKPQAPNHLVVIGYVVTAANNGVIYVKVDNGYELDELHNVLISSAATNEILAYDSVTKVWRNRTSGQLNLASGSGVTGIVPRWASSSGLTDSIIFSTGTVVGINTTNPQQTLHIEGTMRLTGSTGDSTTIMGRNANGDVSAISIGSGLSLSGNTLSSTGGGGGSGTVTGSGTATQVAFWSGATGTTSTALSGSSNLYWDNVNGNLGIGGSTPSASLYIRRDGIGETINESAGIILANTSFVANEQQFSPSITLIGSATRSSLRGITKARITNTSSSAGGGSYFSRILFQIDAGTGTYANTASFSADVASSVGGTGCLSISTIAGSSSGTLFIAGGTQASYSIDGVQIYSQSNTTGADHLALVKSYSSTTQTTPLNYLSIKGTINLTGAASAITRGVYINPTLTSAPSWRSVEWSNNTGYGLYGVGTATNYLAGGLTIGNTLLNSSAILQADSTTLGFLPPRMSTTNKIGIASPAQGLVVYDTTMQALSAYNGSNWATVGGGEQMFTITGSTATINFNAGNIADITLATSTTLTLTGGTFGTFIIKLTQDATGGRVVSWPSNVRWSGGIPPSLTTTGGKVDVISLIFDGTNYYGTYALNF